MEPDKLKQLSKRIRLRLDDGTLITSASSVGIESELSVIHLTLPEVIQLNLVTDADFDRVQRLLSLAELPELPVENGSALKKQRTDSKLCIVQGEDWQSKCRDIVSKLKNYLKGQYVWFEIPVDEQTVPDYYQIVKKPMWFNLIMSKLDSDKYQSPAEFFEDVRLLWTNCQLYNKVGTPVRTAGDKGLRKFDELWLNAGLAGERSKRATAGMPAHKYEPQDFEPSVKGSRVANKSKPTSSGRAHRANSQGNGVGTATTGCEATSMSFARSGGEELSADQRSNIVNALQQVMESLNPEQVNELLEILPPEAISTDESGEQVLDINAVSDSSLLQLYEWLRSLDGAAAAMGLTASAADVGPTSSYGASLNTHAALGANEDDEDYLSD